MKSFTLEFLCDDDFGVGITQAWSTTPQTYSVSGISSVSGSTAYINDLAFKGKNFWTPIAKFLNKFENIKEIYFNELESFLEQFVVIDSIDYNSNGINFNLDNAYDLSSVYLDDNRISFNYSNSPIRNFYLIDLKSYIKIIPSIFSNNYYSITETEWLEFMSALELDISESRNLKLDALLNEETVDSNVNIIRQMNFHCKYGKYNKSNTFIESVLRQHKNGKILSPKQVLAVKSILH